MEVLLREFKVTGMAIEGTSYGCNYMLTAESGHFELTQEDPPPFYTPVFHRDEAGIVTLQECKRE